jgi:hypothetical protein
MRKKSQTNEQVTDAQVVEQSTPQGNTKTEQGQQYLTTSVLVQIQQELKVPKSNFNSFGKYKYRSAEDILESLKPILAKYHSTLLLQDEVKEVAGIPYIFCTAQLITPLGAFQTTASAGIDINKKGMDSAQCFGSSISYARKYALGGLLLIDDTQDSDATNKHDDKPKEADNKLPELSQDRFTQLVDRYNKGEKDIFDKAAKHYSFTTAQKNLIDKVSQLSNAIQ